ncbi:MAG: FtsQ-type POTRA domain-containing protein, partial [Rhodospirillales bacterium]|nr:FtsQ-type POTRA domain-containing protein [Rhodospirillales bacterium]
MRRVARPAPVIRPVRLRRRRKLLPDWVAPTAKVCFVATVAALAVGGPWALWRAGIAQQTIERVETAFVTFTGTVGLVVDDVLVEGRVETKARDVLAALQIQRGMPVLALNPAAAKERLEQIPWVQEASVERRLPGVVHVRLVERVPMALWQHDGRFVLIDKHGAQIETEEVGRFASLPHIVGDNAGEAAGDLLRMLAAEPTLERRVVAAGRVGGRRWNLRLDSGIDVMLPADNAPAAWMQLAEIEREHAVLAR